ncbi:MAG: MarR family winged helix-turn-helix transcriptional regulator [Candidatus Acidiferrales bacterium]
MIATPLWLKNAPLIPSTSGEDSRKMHGFAPSTAVAAHYKLTAVQAKVLLLLQPETAMTMRSIAGALQYDASNLTGVVDRLEEMGVVRRQPHPSDRRAKGVMLTAEGQRVRRAFWERLTGNTGPLGRLNDRELVSLRRLLGIALRNPPR